MFLLRGRLRPCVRVAAPAARLVRSPALMARSREPSVLALLVATNGAAWLPEVLRGLRAQSCPSFDVLAIDNASDDASPALLRKALGARHVLTLERRAGYGRALAAALKRVADAGSEVDAFLLVHDDCALEPGAARAMAGMLEGESVGIVGAKLVEWDDPTLLQAAGGSTDRYGRVFPLIERGELDHGQHDPPREVLYASSACLLVSREVVERIGLFDLRYTALRDDYDLCWRARVAGFRTVVTGAAGARHACAGYRQMRDGPLRGRVRYFGERNMIATVIKNYRLPRLLAVLPITLVLSIASALVFAATGRRASALQVAEALRWNVAHLPSTLRSRVRSQRARRWPDSEVTKLMESGATRLRGYLERALDRVVGDVEPGEEEPARRPGLLELARAHPAAVLGLGFLLVYLVGARTVLGPAPLAGIGMPPFPERAADLLGEFMSGRRTGGVGSAVPATPGLALLGALQWLLLGSAWLVQRALLLGLPILAAATAWAMAGALGFSGAGRRVVSLAYALSPLALGALGAGLLPDMVLVAAAPGLLLPLARAGGLAPDGGWRSAAVGVAGLAVATSLAPWAIPFVLGAAALLGIGRALTGSPKAAAPVLRRAATMCAGALGLLLPWSIELFRRGSALGIGGPGPLARMRDLVALSPGPVAPVPRAMAYGLPLAALLGFAVAAQEKRQVARALAAVASGSLLLAWAVARGVPWIAPRPAEPLVLAAVAYAALAGFAWEGTAARLSRRAFGGRHLVTAVVSAVLLLELGAGALWVAGGSRPGIVDAGALRPAFLAADVSSRGAFRVLWLTGSSRSARFSLAPAEGESMLTYATRRAGPGERALERVVAGLASGADGSAARKLAAFGARYVVLRPEADGSLADSLERQGDLRFSQTFRGARIYENRASLGIAAAVASPEWAGASERGLGALSAAGPQSGAGTGFRALSPGRFSGRAARGARSVLLAEEFGSGWEGRSVGKPVAARRSFGWATAFPVSARGPFEIRWRRQGAHRAALALELALVLGFASAWSRRAARERGRS